MKGPPKPSWDLQFHLLFALIKSFIQDGKNKTVEDIQQQSFMVVPLPADFNEDKVVISNEYRRQAQPYLEKILSEYEHVLDNEWKELEDGNEMDQEEENDVGSKRWLKAKWIYLRERGFKRNYKRIILYLHGGAYMTCNADSYRAVTTKIAKEADALVFAALHDALAAYLYLTNPPENASFETIDPKQIVIMGDSAGGGLTVALGLALRDTGLPMVAGLVVWVNSPWLDLTNSMPSYQDPLFYLTDFIPDGFLVQKSSPALNSFYRKSEALSRRIKKENKLQFWDNSFNRNKRVQLYAPNEALSVPYVSPICATSLAGLPSILVQAGDGERLRDEAIYFSFKASQPEKYNLPSYNFKNSKRLLFKTPTNVTLEIYQDMPHVFQTFSFGTPAKIAYKHSGEFIKKVIDNATNQTSPSSEIVSSLDSTKSTYSLISATGKILPLKEEQYSVLKWTEIGKVPLVANPTFKLPPPTTS
ncbi:3829_t:CDS:2 [Acaulospora colombiana]|uniref:3829_t:CDS:1 n=1 Tax=Acaulospora colombiana TaxID=27376 RepID=A0ACA9KA03_9GLOM|nr:3829_t:CDS:2 [Acaulospora colombiana]